jgi:hypothetical protein
MVKRFLVSVLATMLAAPVYAAEPQLQDVLDRMVQAYGGEENLRKLDHMVQEWDFTALVRNRQGTDIRSIRVPGQLRVELTYPDKKETRVLNGSSAFVVFDGRPPAPAHGPQQAAMRLQLMRLYSPLALRDRIGDLELTADGGFLALSLLDGGLRVDYLVNQDEWRIEKVVGTLSINGGEMRFLTEYSDFAFVKGVLVHRKENKFAGNVNTARLELRRIELDAQFEPARFQP